MKILFIIFCSIIAVVIICWFIYFLVSLIVYILQELNHEIRKAKQSFKRSMRDIEWALKHR